MNPEQLRALQTWFEKSLSNWGYCFYTPPGSSVSISLHHADGTQSWVSLLKFPAAQKQTTLRAAHLNGSNKIEQPCAFQSFSEKDIEELLSIIGVQQ